MPVSTVRVESGNLVSGKNELNDNHKAKFINGKLYKVTN